MNLALFCARPVWLLPCLFPFGAAAQPLCDVLLRPAFHYTTDGLSLLVADSSTTFGLSATASWTFGVGSAPTTDTFHTFDSPGTYTVCLTLTSTTTPACSSTYCRQVVVPLDDCGGFLSAEFSHASSGTNTGAFLETASIPGLGTWLWEFGDGSTSTEEAPVHTWALPGPHFVTLTRQDGPCTATSARWIDVDGNATTCGPGLFVDFSVQQAGDLVYFDPDVITSNIVPLIGVWSFGDGAIDTTLNAQHTFLQPGPYQTCLLVGALQLDDLDSCFSLVCRTHEVVPVTGIGTRSSEAFMIWPNPSSGLVHLESPSSVQMAHLRILDALGRTVLLSEQATPKSSPVDLSRLGPGNYVLEIGTDARVYRSRLQLIRP